MSSQNSKTPYFCQLIFSHNPFLNTSMKSLIFLVLLLGLWHPLAICQEVKVSVELSKKEVLAGNTVQVTFKIENAQNPRIEAIQWPETVQVVGGPSQSSQIQMINGAFSSEIAWVYLVKLNDVGVVVIPEVKFAEGAKNWKSEAVKITVKPNPGGVIDEPEQPKQSQQFDFWGYPMPERKPSKPAQPIRPTVRI
jgi:uncharacterized protein (DUF58 family)